MKWTKEMKEQNREGKQKRKTETGHKLVIRLD